MTKLNFVEVLQEAIFSDDEKKLLPLVVIRLKQKQILKKKREKEQKNIPKTEPENEVGKGKKRVATNKIMAKKHSNCARVSSLAQGSHDDQNTNSESEYHQAYRRVKIAAREENGVEDDPNRSFSTPRFDNQARGKSGFSISDFILENVKDFFEQERELEPIENQHQSSKDDQRLRPSHPDISPENGLKIHINRRVEAITKTFEKNRQVLSSENRGIMVNEDIETPTTFQGPNRKISAQFNFSELDSVPESPSSEVLVRKRSSHFSGAKPSPFKRMGSRVKKGSPNYKRMRISMNLGKTSNKKLKLRSIKRRETPNEELELEEAAQVSPVPAKIVVEENHSINNKNSQNAQNSINKANNNSPMN